MKDKKIQKFVEFNESLDTSDSKYQIGDTVTIKEDLSDIIGKIGYQDGRSKHPLYKGQDNDGMVDFIGKQAKITYVVTADDKSNDRKNIKCSRYLLDIDNGDYWWIDECFI